LKPDTKWKSLQELEEQWSLPKKAWTEWE
jgi:hypothetical protein